MRFVTIYHILRAGKMILHFCYCALIWNKSELKSENRRYITFQEYNFLPAHDPLWSDWVPPELQVHHISWWMGNSLQGDKTAAWLKHLQQVERKLISEAQDDF